MFPEFNRLFINKALEDIIGELDLFSKTREQSDKFLEEEWPKLEQGVERKGPYGDRPDVARSEMAHWRQTLRNREEDDEALEAWFDPRNKEMTQEALDVLHKAKKDFEEEAALDKDLLPFKKLYQQGKDWGIISSESDNRQKKITSDFEKFLEEEEALESYITDDVSDDDWWETGYDDNDPSTDNAKWEFINKVLEENPERDPNKPIYLPDETAMEKRGKSGSEEWYENWEKAGLPNWHDIPLDEYEYFPDEAYDEVTDKQQKRYGEIEKIAKQLAKEEGQGWILKAISSGRIPAAVALGLIGTLWSEPAY